MTDVGSIEASVSLSFPKIATVTGVSSFVVSSFLLAIGALLLTVIVLLAVFVQPFASVAVTV